jgi:dephospho-CoA kinase
MRLALYGYSGSGKDYLIENVLIPKGFVRLSFSDQLKKCAKKIFSWIEQDYPPEKKEKPLNIRTSTGELIDKTPREIWLSLNSIRQIEDNIFIRMVQENLELLQGVENIVISDVRTPNEYNWAIKNGFTIIKIENKNPIHKKNDFDKQQDSFKASYTFENRMNGTTEFEKFVEEILSKENF